MEAELLSSASLAGQYVPIPEHWATIESLGGYLVVLSPSITFRGSHLLKDSYWGVWVVAFTDFITKMDVYILLDAYAAPRLCYMSQKSWI